MDAKVLLRNERLRHACPMPWIIDQDNSSGICVKDNTGDTIFYEDLACIPDEMSSSQRETIVCKARAIAYFLVAWSESQTP